MEFLFGSFGGVLEMKDGRMTVGFACFVGIKISIDLTRIIPRNNGGLC